MQLNLEYFKNLKRKREPISALTAYDATQAQLFEKIGIEIILVGDSLGMLFKGEENTLGVSMREMVYHTQSVSRVLKKSYLITDMPFLSYPRVELALKNAGLLIKKGKAKMVKIEGASQTTLEVIEALLDNNIPVCGHLGLTPQAILKLGKYSVQGKNIKEVVVLKRNMEKLEEIGVSMLVLECVPKKLAQEITEATNMVVIGIGSGNACDGQILVHYDALGMSEKKMKFVRNFLNLEIGVSNVQEAIKKYLEEVKNRKFPNSTESYE